MSLLCPSPSGERRKNAEKIEILESLKKITISEDFEILKKNRNRVLSALIKNKYPDKIFDIEIPTSLPTILVDKDRFQQVVMNLVENAAKYSIDNTIKICANYSSKPDYISINVSDIGIKIEKEDFDKIFEKFSRIDSPLTRKVQGSGLGLYITKNIVEKMNGEIRVTSETIDANKANTTFTIEFPICNVETQAREKCKQ